MEGGDRGVVHFGLASVAFLDFEVVMIADSEVHLARTILFQNHVASFLVVWMIFEVPICSQTST
jgi:hypothetical protein